MILLRRIFRRRRQAPEQLAPAISLAPAIPLTHAEWDDYQNYPTETYRLGRPRHV